MVKYTIGDCVRFRDIDESGHQFWSKGWRVEKTGKDGYILKTGRYGDEWSTFLPYKSESKMRKSTKCRRK